MNTPHHQQQFSIKGDTFLMQFVIEKLLIKVKQNVQTCFRLFLLQFIFDFREALLTGAASTTIHTIQKCSGIANTAITSHFASVSEQPEAKIQNLTGFHRCSLMHIRSCH